MKHDLLALDAGSVKLQEPRQGRRMRAVQAGVGEALPAGLFVEVVGQGLVPRDVFAPHD